MNRSWDPSLSSDWDNQKFSAICQKRMSHDIRQLMEEEESDGLRIYVFPNDQDISKMQVLVIGPPDTPYEDGFFLFYVRISPVHYPTVPPRVRNLTTGGSTVRFGPNFYADGKVCLSILGTFPGPSWTPAMNISGVLKSIQSLMSDCALRNEPGNEHLVKTDRQVMEYDRSILHETIRVAIVDAVKKTIISSCETPLKFRRIILQHFMKTVDILIKKCEERKSTDGVAMSNYYGITISVGKYRWSGLSLELLQLKQQVPTMLKALGGADKSRGDEVMDVD